MNLKNNVFWNTFGTLVLLGAQWITTILVVRLSDNYNDAGVYSLAMSVSNIFYIIAIYNVRNFQVSDIRGEYQDEDYLFHRLTVMGIALTACVGFTLISYRDMYTIGVVISYMVFRMGESLVDVLHGMDQRVDRMDIVGKSYLLRGIYILIAFAAGEIITHNLLYTIWLMAIGTTAIIILYDYRQTKSLVHLKIHVNWNQIKKIYIVCFPLLIYGITLNIVPSWPRIVAERELGSQMLGYYASVATPAVIVQSIANVIFAPFITTITKYYEEKRAKEFYRISIGMVLMCVVLGGCAYFGSMLFGKFVLVDILYKDPDLIPYCYLLNSTMICTALIAVIWFLAILLTVARATVPLTFATVLGAIVEIILAKICIERYAIDGINRSLIITYILMIMIMVCVIMIYTHNNFKGEKNHENRC